MMQAYGRINTVQIKAEGGPRTKAAAEAALHGPPAWTRAFVQYGQYIVKQSDQRAAVHNAEMARLVHRGLEAAAEAQQQAYEAAQAAAAEQARQAEVEKRRQEYIENATTGQRSPNVRSNRYLTKPANVLQHTQTVIRSGIHVNSNIHKMRMTGGTIRKLARPCWVE